ncbi:MAG: uncharacterized protein A8A55_0742 [Amphiamblys sp. WSBS2006]|nr:MAG: uncharacterized protein A8A55_0742 [Amphiamblys sp. WSBS2006]
MPVHSVFETAQNACYIKGFSVSSHTDKGSGDVSPMNLLLCAGAVGVGCMFAWDEKEVAKMDQFFKNSIDLLTGARTPGASSVMESFDLLQTGRFWEDRTGNIRKVLENIKLFSEQGNTGRALGKYRLWNLLDEFDVGRLLDGYSHSDVVVIRESDTKVHPGEEDERLYIVIGDGNRIHLQGEYQKLLVVGDRNQVRVLTRRNFIFIEGQENQTITIDEENTVFVSPRSNNGRVYVDGPFGNIFVLGSNTKICILDSFSTVYVGPRSSHNRVYSFNPVNWVWISGDENKIASLGRKNSYFISPVSARNRFYVEGDDNFLHFNGARSDIYLKAGSERNLVLLGALSRNNTVHSENDKNRVRDRGSGNELKPAPSSEKVVQMRPTRVTNYWLNK